MRIRICSVYDTAYKYKEILKDYNYEHILHDDATIYAHDEDDLNDYDTFIYTDYITLNSLDDILNLKKSLKKPIIIEYYEDELCIEIYDSYRE